MICDNSDDIRNVQKDAFQRAYGISDYAPCSQHAEVDLRFWKECCPGEGEIGNIYIFLDSVIQIFNISYQMKLKLNDEKIFCCYQEQLMINLDINS